MFNKEKMIETYGRDGEYLLLMREQNGILSVWQSADDIVYSDVLNEKRLMQINGKGDCHLRGDDFQEKELLCKEGNYVSELEVDLWKSADLSLLTKDKLFEFGIDIVICPNVIEEVYHNSQCRAFIAINTMLETLNKWSEKRVFSKYRIKVVYQYLINQWDVDIINEGDQTAYTLFEELYENEDSYKELKKELRLISGNWKQVEEEARKTSDYEGELLSYGETVIESVEEIETIITKLLKTNMNNSDETKLIMFDIYIGDET